MPDSHEGKARVLDGPHELSERRSILRIKAEQAANHSCELEIGRSLRSLRSEPQPILMEG